MSIRSRARRTLAATAAFVLVASMLLVGWHRATVLHGKCLEHGEDVHLERIGTGVTTVSEIATVTPSNWRQVDGDSHCEILATANTPLTAAHAPAAQHVVLAVADVAQPPIAIATPAAIELYRLAPKTSPPRV